MSLAQSPLKGFHATLQFRRKVDNWRIRDKWNDDWRIRDKWNDDGKRLVHEILGHPDGVGLLNGEYPAFLWDGTFILLPNGEAIDFPEVLLIEVRP